MQTPTSSTRYRALLNASTKMVLLKWPAGSSWACRRVSLHPTISAGTVHLAHPANDKPPSSLYLPPCCSPDMYNPPARSSLSKV